MRWFSALLCCIPAWSAVWTLRLEEPTGIYRRVGEVVAVPLDRLSHSRGPFVAVDEKGAELPWQVAGEELLLPASLMPGMLPVYRIAPAAGRAPRFHSGILLRKIGLRRVEFGNQRFRIMIDMGVPAVVEAYSLRAGPQRMLNLVETTPEDSAQNPGWFGLGGSGPITGVEFLEAGPLRGRLRLTRAGGTWEFLWTADSAWVRWKAQKGFRFAAISAAPYAPFDRSVDGSESAWPTGPDPEEPPDHQVATRAWKKLPGGHIVYYQRAENYGALGLVALDAGLDWTGAGSRRVEASKSSGDTEIAITFPEWRGDDTVMEARRENRVLRNPILVQVAGPEPGTVQVKTPLPRESEQHTEHGAFAPSPFQPATVSLDGEWELAWGEKGAGPSSEWRRVRVPGSAHVQWLDASKLYTREAEWVSYKEWWYRKRFRLPREFSGRRVRLQFDATDYYADAFLNGKSLGRHEGYIDPYDYTVTPYLNRAGENELLVRCWTPVSYYWRHRPYTVKGSYGAVDQKPDDITPLGITRGVRLVAGEAAVVRQVAVNTRLAGQGADVEVDVEAEAAGPGHQWELTLRPRNFVSSDGYRLRAPVSKGVARLVLHLDAPRLWWTWDHGRPNLYTLEVRLLDGAGKAVDGRSLAVGIREIEKIGWVFYLNHKRLFLRGTNYYYNLFLSEMNRAAYERDMRLILGMNVNLIRVHCHFSNPEFYDLADELGVMIWQDYLEAWYPHDTEFARRAAELYDAHIRYVRNHPSVAVWATSDEEDLENYRDLTKHLAPRLFLHDPQRRAVVRSTGRYGDAHVYHGWYDGSIWQYASMEEAFVTELGATSLPNYESLIKFLPNHWPIRDHAEEWIFRKLQIPEAMRAWGDPGGMTLQEYIPRTQAYVARLFQIALERMRRRKYDAGGVFHFHAIDIWPSVTMAAIDFYRVPTKVYYTVQRSFAPVLASLEYDRDRWKVGERMRCGIWAVNDDWEELPGAEIRWRIVKPGGMPLQEGVFPASMPADSSRKLGVVEWAGSEPGAYQLRAQVLGPNGHVISENVFEFELVR